MTSVLAYTRPVWRSGPAATARLDDLLLEVRMLLPITIAVIRVPPTWLLRVAILVTLASGMIACTPPEPLRIGFLGGLSGRVADLGIGGRNGAILAVEMRNQQGGINGRRVELIAEDDQQDVEVARQAVAACWPAKST
jgi:ABC-type branched-subunit amino acid transport system substrate-binding protein